MAVQLCAGSAKRRRISWSDTFFFRHEMRAGIPAELTDPQARTRRFETMDRSVLGDVVEAATLATLHGHHAISKEAS